MEVKHLNEILFEIEEKGFFVSTKDTPEHLDKALKRLEREDLVYEKNSYTYDLTTSGQDAIDSGGYQNWKTGQKQSMERDDEIKDLTIQQLKGNIFQLKYWWVILIISSILGFISGNFQLIGKWIFGE